MGWDGMGLRYIASSFIINNIYCWYGNIHYRAMRCDAAVLCDLPAVSVNKVCIKCIDYVVFNEIQCEALYLLNKDGFR
jgi:hypothetical protein